MITIRARELRRSFRTKDRRLDVLNGVSLDLSAGAVTALVGRSGSGKSTLLNVLGLLSRADSGRLDVLDRDVVGLDADATADLRSRHIGFVFQAFNLLPHLSARDNVALPCRNGLRAGRVAAVPLLEKVGLGHRLGHRPGELSAGEQQRVALARALMNDPAVVLADEPTGNLDAETETVLLSLFREMADDGRTVLLVTHNDSVAAAADSVLRMDQGLIISETVAS